MKSEQIIKSSIREELEENGRIIYSNVGDSMEPLIRQGRDLLVIERPDGRLKRVDIPLYQREGSRRYVLHRILKVREQDYVICGDNRWNREYGITDRQIVGVLTSIIRNGRERPLSGFRYGLYLFFWCRLFPLRATILRGKAVIKKVLRKVIKR